MTYLYQITNTRTGQYYIGASRAAKWPHYMGCGRAIKAAIAAEGREHFRKDILAECRTAQFAFQLEAAVVDAAFVARADTYNIKLGGPGLTAHTPEARHLIGEASLGRKNTPETLAKMSRSAKERVAVTPPEQRARWQTMLRERQRPPEELKRLREAAKAQWRKQKAEGFTYSPEAIQHMREAATKREAAKRLQRVKH